MVGRAEWYWRSKMQLSRGGLRSGSAVRALADLESELPGHGVGLRPVATVEDHSPQVRWRHDRISVAGEIAPQQVLRRELDHVLAVAPAVHGNVREPATAVVAMHD